MLWAVSRAPLEKLQAFKRRMGWTFPWASALNSDFNPDFNVYFTEEEQREGRSSTTIGARSRWRPSKEDDMKSRIAPDGGHVRRTLTGTDVGTYTRERPGMSAFALEDGVVYHTYSAFARGLDGLWGMYQWLDRAPKGRNEKDFWIRHHDAYQR